MIFAESCAAAIIVCDTNSKADSHAASICGVQPAPPKCRMAAMKQRVTAS